ncbi:carph-isopro domain-containing protein [Aquamicrobium segne]|uniref:Carph-isopro domain-containing protein n=1 Tax=Aquamicrobium segne TaxID=469547 RepID=A0ABW0GUP7_9HYPH
MTPAEHVIDKFGGLTSLARALDCAVSTVQGWKERGRIPQEHWLQIITAGKERGLALEFDDFILGPSEVERVA